MLKYEIIEIGGIDYDHTYSDAGYMIERDGVLYAEAVDPLNCGRVYTETDIPIGRDEPYGDATSEDYIAALGELGVDTSEEENS
ncbi:MAG: hypothetical protein IKN38_08635 [Clostridia bacterium]|nr:hypothetical protein [Clostridia bacterium]